MHILVFSMLEYYNLQEGKSTTKNASEYAFMLKIFRFNPQNYKYKVFPAKLTKAKVLFTYDFHLAHVFTS